jgi:hypothetical protein
MKYMSTCANITTMKKLWNLEPCEPDPVSHQRLYDGGERNKIPFTRCCSLKFF